MIKMFNKDKRGQSGVIAAMIGLAVLVIIVLQVTMPIVQTTLDNSSITGTPITILGNLNTIIAVGLLVLAVGASGIYAMTR